MTDQLKKLEADFNTQLVPGSIKGAMKSANASSRDLWFVPYKNLKELPGFNVRVINASYIAKTNEYADSMVENGWLRNSILEGFVAVENGEQVIYYTAGHTRLRAVEIANSRGANIEYVPIVICTKAVSMDDLQVALIQGNEANALSLYEKGIVCNRLLKAGYSEADIERRTGVKNPILGKLFKLMAAPFKLKELVAFETISATFAFEMIEQHGPKALEVIQGAINKASEKGSVKVTKKFVEGADRLKLIKKSAPSMFSTLESIKDDPGYSGLSPELRAGIDSIFLKITNGQVKQ